MLRKTMTKIDLAKKALQALIDANEAGNATPGRVQIALMAQQDGDPMILYLCEGLAARLRDHKDEEGYELLQKDIAQGRSGDTSNCRAALLFLCEAGPELTPAGKPDPAVRFLLAGIQVARDGLAEAGMVDGIQIQEITIPKKQW